MGQMPGVLFTPVLLSFNSCQLLPCYQPNQPLQKPFHSIECDREYQACSDAGERVYMRFHCSGVLDVEEIKKKVEPSFVWMEKIVAADSISIGVG